MKTSLGHLPDVKQDELKLVSETIGELADPEKICIAKIESFTEGPGEQ